MQRIQASWPFCAAIAFAQEVGQESGFLCKAERDGNCGHQSCDVLLWFAVHEAYYEIGDLSKALEFISACVNDKAEHIRQHHAPSAKPPESTAPGGDVHAA